MGGAILAEILMDNNIPGEIEIKNIFINFYWKFLKLFIIEFVGIKP